jgi:hypothetical protein
MKLISLWDGADSPTRFIVGCEETSNDLKSYFDNKGYAYELSDLTFDEAHELNHSRSEEESKRVFKWMKKFWNVQEH